jgi:hypothetical protein
VIVPRRILISCAVVTLVVGGVAGGVSAASVPNLDRALALNGVWNRLSLDRAHPAPEHESLACGGFIVWNCVYFKIPEPALNFYWNTNKGYFQGSDITANWACPAWFPAGICGNVTQVVHGTIVFVDPGVHPPLSVLADLIVSGTGSSRKLNFYWVGRFVCPWFRTFAQALAANPMPLPFDGVNWAPQDCVSAP